MTAQKKALEYFHLTLYKNQELRMNISSSAKILKTNTARVLLDCYSLKEKQKTCFRLVQKNNELIIFDQKKTISQTATEAAESLAV